MTASIPPPVQSWSTDFDHTHPDYNENAFEIWDHLRSECPVAHSDRFGGVWLPVRHAEVEAIARDTENYSSQGVVVAPNKPEEAPPIGPAPPITSDPPFHAIARRMLLPPFAPKRIEELQPLTTATCNALIDAIVERNDGHADAAVEYSQHIPVRIIARMLGVPPEDGDLFRVFIHRIIGNPGADAEVPEEESLGRYLTNKVDEHRANPRSPEDGDLIDYLLSLDIDGEPLSDEHIVGTAILLLIAGIDTTWSSIGSALWHLATHPEDQDRYRNDPDVRLLAVEEFLRAYAPVTMARIAATDHDLGGCPVKSGDWLLLPFPAANRDPEQFEDADKFIIDRQQNRHGAFGLGIHRCLGSNLARMELRTALDIWVDRFRHFELSGETVTWSTGQIRGPRVLPMKVTPA